MVEIDDGGAAFPLPDTLRPDGEHVLHAERGMSLRDYFAAQALGAAIREWSESRPKESETWDQMIARISYEIADAMIVARRAEGRT